METKQDTIVLPKPPNNHQTCSEACFRFQHRHHQIFDFFFFGIRLATHVDEARNVAAKALAEGGTPKDKALWESAQSEPNPAFKKLQSFGNYQSETMVIRSVDNFLSYMSEIMQSCIRRKPELLKSGDQVRTEDVLRFSSKRDLIEFLLNRKLNELAYGGISAIDDFLKSKTNIPITPYDDQIDKLSVAIELRNIYTHNRGVVNELFIRRLSNISHDFDFRIGKRFHAHFDDVSSLANNMFNVVINLDKQLITKFRIRKKRYSTWDSNKKKSDST